MWQLNNMLLNNQWITEEIKQEIKKYPETYKNKKAMIKNLPNKPKLVLRVKDIVIHAYLKKQEKSQKSTYQYT